MGRKCAVPHCYTGYRKCKEKASLYRVPDDDFFLNKWQEAIAREDRPITPKDYVCEKHFKDDDILRRRIIKDVVEEYQRPRLKPDAIPSIFPDLPEFILKMVKKRRKIIVENKDTDSSICNDNDESEYPQINAIEEVKLEPIDMNEDNFIATSSIRNESMLNNEIDIKSEPEENIMESLENEANEKDDSNYGPKMHHCDQCFYQTKYIHNLRTHKTKHLTGEGAYLHCEYCPNYKTKWELTLRNHLKIKHGIGKQEIFKCTLCQFETKVKLCLKRHYYRHNREILNKKLMCTFAGCFFMNESKALLDMHIRSHKDTEPIIESINEKPKSFKCTECFYETNSKTHIIRHIKSAHSTGDDTVVSVYAKQDSPLLIATGFKEMEPNDKYQNPTGLNELKTKIWKCPKCPYATFLQHALKKHRQTECEKDIYFCADCNFKSCSKTRYIKHTFTHKNLTVESVSRDRIVTGEIERLCVEPDVIREADNFQRVESKWENEEESGSNAVHEFVLVKIKDEN